MKPQKLIWQIYPATLIVVLAAIVAATWYGSTVFTNFYLDEAEKDLESRANLIKSNVYDYIRSASFDELRKFSREAGRESGTRITIIDRQGLVLADSNENPDQMDNHGERPEIVAAYGGLRGRSLRHSSTLGENMLYIAIPMQGRYSLSGSAERGQDVSTVIRMSTPVTSLDRTLHELRVKVVIGCIFIIVAAAAIALLISRNISRTLEEMTRTAGQFARGDFRQRMAPLLKTTSSLEVTALATSMDRMAEMLDEKIKTIITHRNQLETVFSSMIESVIAIDLEERIISVNEAGARLFGTTREQAQGKVVQEVLRHINLQEQIRQVLDTSEALESEIVIQADEGEKYLQTTVVSLTDGKGESVGVLVVLNDMTSIRRLENIRSDFVANVSHELRTPITSIRGYVETLLDGALDDRENSTKFLEIVLRQSERLGAIIDDLLALSRIEQESNEGMIRLEYGPLCGVLDTALQTCQVNARQQGVKIELYCQDKTVALMNDTLIEQAVVNLLVNAIKYSKEGDVIRIASRINVNDGGSWLRISVKDTGCGIAPEHLPRLFERFYRSDKARSREQGGTGLGLAIVKHIAQAHGGAVDVLSVPGEGSEFILTLKGYIN